MCNRGSGQEEDIVPIYSTGGLDEWMDGWIRTHATLITTTNSLTYCARSLPPTLVVKVEWEAFFSLGIRLINRPQNNSHDLRNRFRLVPHYDFFGNASMKERSSLAILDPTDIIMYATVVESSIPSLALLS